MMDSANDEAELGAESARIERLLSELRDLVPLATWQRVEDVLRRIIGLYSAALARALDHARAQGAAGPAFDEALCDDELVASLLLLHGLHPLSTEQRVREALAAVRAELGLADDALTLAHIRDGIVHVTATDAIAGSSLLPGLAEGTIRRVLETAAPEISCVEFSGLPPEPAATA